MGKINKVIIICKDNAGEIIDYQANWTYDGDTLETLKKARMFLDLLIEDYEG